METGLEIDVIFIIITIFKISFLLLLIIVINIIITSISHNRYE